MQPEPLQRFFDRAAARLRLLAGLRGAALALAAGLPLIALRWFGAMPLAPTAAAIVSAVVLVGLILMWRSPRRADLIAAAVESRTPAARNVLITAAEIETRATPLRADVKDVVLRDAADAASRVNLAEIFPLGRALAWTAALAVIWSIGLAIDSSTVARARGRLTAGGGSNPEISRVVVIVTPPAYTGRPAQTMTDPERIDAIAGSALEIEVDGDATEVELAAVGERHRLPRDASGRFTGRLTANADGFVALQPFGAADAAGVRRVMPLGVTPDHPPLARITAPGKDLFLAKPDQTLPVMIEATDDLGLASLRLTFTKVTGSGENFKFTSGEFPVEITRAPPGAGPDTWTAAASIPLPKLDLAPGDLLVYRAVVADRRPGGEAVESDAFIIQILLPGEALSEGFAIDEEKDRYAISQQMIIVKTERLIAAKSKLAPGDFADQVQTLAAEQRKVRAEFVFMMGGEFEDVSTATGDLNEQEEAANESELAAGRMQNNGRRDIISATRFMSGAAQKLTNLDPIQALPDEKAALVSLQRAFTKSRYILRVLTPRERIDDSRRLSGKLDGVSEWRRPAPSLVDDPRARALLAALADVSQLVALPRYSSADANRLSATAESILRLDPKLSAVAQAFSQASAAIGSGKTAPEVARLIDTAAVALSSAARDGVPAAPVGADPSRSRLSGALADALGRSGGRR